ncbi:MAG: cyclic pyranopterin monophosphate synthase MoaC [Spirochaetia bacterium]|jgi:cyclic pyranopterin phosphate synthase|nr:cyclic pyranopterin monophosphate synthase MoaC [Spirochaetia bacterium]
MSEFSHYSQNGESVMVDVSAKGVTVRTAKAEGFVKMQPATLDLIEKRLLPKGNLFEVSRIAGIMAAKKNAELIPMCHPLNLSFVNVDIEFDRPREGIYIRSEIRMEGKTGAEMEALTAVSVAALTVYDMVKAVDKEMVIGSIRLLEKRGGKSDYSAQNQG